MLCYLYIHRNSKKNVNKYSVFYASIFLQVCSFLSKILVFYQHFLYSELAIYFSIFLQFSGNQRAKSEKGLLGHIFNPFTNILKSITLNLKHWSLRILRTSFDIFFKKFIEICQKLFPKFSKFNVSNFTWLVSKWSWRDWKYAQGALFSILPFNFSKIAKKLKDLKIITLF